MSLEGTFAFVCDFESLWDCKMFQVRSVALAYYFRLMNWNGFSWSQHWAQAQTDHPVYSSVGSPAKEWTWVSVEVPSSAWSWLGSWLKEKAMPAQVLLGMIVLAEALMHNNLLFIVSPQETSKIKIALVTTIPVLKMYVPLYLSDWWGENLDEIPLCCTEQLFVEVTFLTDRDEVSGQVFTLFLLPPKSHFKKKKLIYKYSSWNEIFVWPHRKCFVQIIFCLFWGSQMGHLNPIIFLFYQQTVSPVWLYNFLASFREMKKNNNQPPATPVFSPCYLFGCAVPATHTHTKQSYEHLQTSPCLWAAAVCSRWQTDLSTYLFKCFLCFAWQQPMCAQSRYDVVLFPCPKWPAQLEKTPDKYCQKAKFWCWICWCNGNDSSETTQVTSDLCILEGGNLISWLLIIFLPF